MKQLLHTFGHGLRALLSGHDTVAQRTHAKHVLI
jgi:hypothetical protein